MEKNTFFVIPEMPSKTFVMVLKKLPDHFKHRGIYLLGATHSLLALLLADIYLRFFFLLATIVPLF